VVGCCECDDEPSGSGATELLSLLEVLLLCLQELATGACPSALSTLQWSFRLSKSY
jgi:hypothetical protein